VTASHGFVARHGGDEVLVHLSHTAGEGYRAAERGQKVELEVGPGDEARSVRAV